MKRSSWKRCEREIAKLLGGTRIPVTGRKGPDVEHPRLSIEVKSRKDLPAYLFIWLWQAEDGALAGKIPIVVLHSAHHCHRTDDLVLMRLSGLVQLLEASMEGRDG